MDSRKTLAIISNSCPPYRLHLHRRIVDELKELQLFTLFSHEDPAWNVKGSPEIGPVFFGIGEPAIDQARPSRALHEWNKAGRIIRWLRDHHPVAVVVSGYNDVGRLRILRWCHHHRVPCMHFGDSNIRGDRGTGIQAWIKRQVLSKVVEWSDALLVCGRLGREYFEKYGADSGKIFYFPYEPDYSLVQNLPQSQLQAVAQRFGLKPGRRRLVFSGRLVLMKRVDLFIKAFTAIADRRPDWDAVIVGDGELRKELESLLPARLNERVVWTGFLDDQPAVSAIYRLSDVLVLPSNNEPWALVINESVAAGMAIVASDVVGAAAELVRDRVNGRIFRGGDLNQLTECLLDATDPDNTDRYKAASAGVLSDWRRAGDPVEGLRQALKHVGAI